MIYQCKGADQSRWRGRFLSANDLRRGWAILCEEENYPGRYYWLDSACKEAKVDTCLTSDNWNIYDEVGDSFTLPASVSCGCTANAGCIAADDTTPGETCHVGSTTVLKECKANGGWGQWSPWSDCSVTCDKGIEKRTRACDDPKPDDGGKPCPETEPTTEQEKSCVKDRCPDATGKSDPTGKPEAGTGLTTKKMTTKTTTHRMKGKPCDRNDDCCKDQPKPCFLTCHKPLGGGKGVCKALPASSIPMSTSAASDVINGHIAVGACMLLNLLNYL